MSLAFIGLGLNDEKGMTLEGLEEARRADSVYGEFYTNIMPNLDLKRLEKEIGKKVEVLSRSQLEDEGGEKLLRAASRERVAFLVPGDPLIATTHVSLRLSLAKMAIPSRVFKATSSANLSPFLSISHFQSLCSTRSRITTTVASTP